MAIKHTQIFHFNLTAYLKPFTTKGDLKILLCVTPNNFTHETETPLLVKGLKNYLP